MSRRSAWCVLVLLALAACAIPEPPPGGPEDRAPPTVEATTPADGASGFPPDGRIEILFSEAMRRANLERQLAFRPPVVVGKAKWKGRMLVISTEDPLHPDTTYVVELKPGYTDAHGVQNKDPFTFAFATSSHIDSGLIAGRVFFRRKPTGRAIVRAFVLPRDSVFSPEAARPDREVTTATDGAFEHRYLPSRGQAFVIWAFEDENDNKRFDPEVEAGAVLADTVVLTPARTASQGHRIFIVDPKEPAEIKGSIQNATGNDTVPITVTLHAINDTLAVTHITRCSPKGEFTFGRVLTNEYVLNAFLDLRVDSLCGVYSCPDDTTFDCHEPCAVYPDTLSVEPGEKLQLDELMLEAATEPRRPRGETKP